jgi:transposase-like protein
MNTLLTRTEPLPLCAAYFGVMIDRLEASIQCDEGPAMHSVCWAVGLLADGELETLGAWVSPCDDESSVRRLFADLKDRGVEAVRFVVGPDALVSRVHALAAFPRARVLPSFESLLRQCLREVAPTHKGVVRGALRSVVDAESLHSVQDALSSFAAGPLGRRYAALVERWHRVMVDSSPFFALSPRHRRALSLVDGLVPEIHERVRRAHSRPGMLPSSSSVSALVEVALARIGHRLPSQTVPRRIGVVRYGGRPAAASLAA